MKKQILVGIVWICSISFPAQADIWKQDAKGWWYEYNNGSYPKSTWEWIDGDKDGYAECYYFDENGYAKLNTKIDVYQLDSNGAWIDTDSKKVIQKSLQNNKKGLAVSGLRNSSAKELGVEHIIWNNPIGNDYTHDFAKAKEEGFTNTVIILNPWQTKTPDLLPVHSQQEGAVLYGFPVETQESRQAVERAAKQMAQSYKDVVTNWVIGNEINNGNTWNFLPNRELEAYTKQYAESFKIWYYAIKEENPTANIYIPFDYRWNWYSEQGYGYLQAKDMLPRLNQILKNTEYGIAWHAYPENLKDPDFTDDIHAKDDPNTAIINMKNIHILTDFMQQEEYLDPNGEVRSIILSEQGFHANSETKQAEMIEKAYYTAKENPYIDIFFLSREYDVGEVHAGQEMLFGLMDRTGRRRESFERYKNIK